MSTLVTGASGYIGRVLCHELASKGYSVKGVGRTSSAFMGFDYAAVDLESAEMYELVKGRDCIVHLAGRAHVLGEIESISGDIYRKANSDLSIRLVQASIDAGVKRFVFISSIGVNGSHTNDRPFSESSSPDPQTPYAISKYTAENELRKLVSTSPMELVVIRPPLVYAGEAPGNFSRLMKLVSIGLPLPFGAVKNARSMIALGNLVDFIQVCMFHPAAANELFVVADNQNFSTPEIVRYLAQGMGKDVILLPFFDSPMRGFLSLMGKKTIYIQLYGSLVIDSGKAKSLLGWTPPFDPRQCLIDAGRFFKTNAGKRN